MKLAILGASGHGKVVADTAELLGYECVFFDDAWPNIHNNGPWRIIGTSQDLYHCLDKFAGVAVAIGNNAIRQQKIKSLQALGARLPTLIHPDAVISKHASIADGTVAFAQAVVNAGSAIGQGVILNTSCTVDHDCIIHDFAHLSPGSHLAGGVQVGIGAWVGLGACIKQLTHIGQQSIVGMGAVVIHNVSAGTTVVGNPARILKHT